MSNQNVTGYGYRIIAKQFDGDPNNHDIWEYSFMATLRKMKLHVELDHYSDDRTNDFNETKAKIFI